MDLSKENAQQTLSMIGTNKRAPPYKHAICKVCMPLAEDIGMSFQNLSPLPFHDIGIAVLRDMTFKY